jgi:hypothetical protein
MNMFLDFFIIIFNNHVFEIGIKKIYWNTSKDHNLFQVNGELKCTCKISFFIVNIKIHQTELI